MLTQNAKLNLRRLRGDRVVSVRCYNPNLLVVVSILYFSVAILYFPVTIDGLVLVLAHFTKNDLSQFYHFFVYTNLLLNFMLKWFNPVLILISVILVCTGEHCVHWNMKVPTLRGSVILVSYSI